MAVFFEPLNLLGPSLELREPPVNDRVKHKQLRLLAKLRLPDVVDLLDEFLAFACLGEHDIQRLFLVHEDELNELFAPISSLSVWTLLTHGCGLFAHLIIASDHLLDRVEKKHVVQAICAFLLPVDEADDPCRGVAVLLQRQLELGPGGVKERRFLLVNEE